MKSMMVIFAYAVLGILFQCNFAGAEDITIYPTLPGTNIRDFSKPGATLSLQEREG